MKFDFFFNKSYNLRTHYTRVLRKRRISKFHIRKTNKNDKRRNGVDLKRRKTAAMREFKFQMFKSRNFRFVVHPHT